MKTDTDDMVRVTVTLNRESDPEWFHLIRSINSGRARADILRRNLMPPPAAVVSAAKASALSSAGSRPGDTPDKLPEVKNQGASRIVGEAVGTGRNGDKRPNDDDQNLVSKNLGISTLAVYEKTDKSNSSTTDSAVTRMDAGIDPILNTAFMEKSAEVEGNKNQKSSDHFETVKHPEAKESSSVENSVSGETVSVNGPVEEPPRRRRMAAAVYAGGPVWAPTAKPDAT